MNRTLTFAGLVLALVTAPAVHATTIAKQALICRHLETLDQYRRSPNVVQFYTEQHQRDECVWSEASKTLRIGTPVRIEKRSLGHDIWVAPVGSTEPCLWTSDDAVAE